MSFANFRPRLVSVVGLAIIALIIGAILPILRLSLGVGTADLQIEFRAIDEDGSPLPQTEIELREYTEGSVEPINVYLLTTDALGLASRTVPGLTCTNATDIFGRERDYRVAIPWWEVTARKPEFVSLQNQLLFDLTNGSSPRAEHTGPRKAKILVPIRMRRAT